MSVDPAQQSAASTLGGKVRRHKAPRDPAGLNLNFSPPATATSASSAGASSTSLGSSHSSTPVVHQRRQQPKSVEELRRILDMVQNKLSVIIDSLEVDDNEQTLKRNVGTAVKHLKQISTLLEQS